MSCASKRAETESPNLNPCTSSTVYLSSRRCDHLDFLLYFAGDEAIISMSVAGEVTDASIMEIGRSRPQFQYSRVSVTFVNIIGDRRGVHALARGSLACFPSAKRSLVTHCALLCVQEELMLIKNLRLSKRRPAFLDTAYNKYVAANFPFEFYRTQSMVSTNFANFAQLTRRLGSGALAFGPKAQRYTPEGGEDWRTW